MNDAPRYADWIGRTETASDVVTPVPAVALAATLDDGLPAPGDGEPLPPLWHWLYFLPHPPRREVGPDGHAARGGFLPPVPLPRRMWAGGRLTWHAPLRVGDTAVRTSRVDDVATKAGQSGALVFVRVRHEIATPPGLALVEEHDIVYRDVAPAGAASPAAPRAPVDEAWSEPIVPDDVLLFRYSALTFNGHRIHYDRRYATEVEGYPGLVVHGPLIATLLAGLVRRHRPDATLSHFAFRAVSPIFDVDPFTVCGRPSADGSQVDLWARRDDGGLAMTAVATLCGATTP